MCKIIDIYKQIVYNVSKIKDKGCIDMRKKIVAVFLSATMALLAFVGCNNKNDNTNHKEVAKEITDIKFNSSGDIELQIGYCGYKYLYINGSGYDDYSNEIEFVSTKPSVANIKLNDKSNYPIECQIEATSVGETTIYAQTRDGKLKTDEVTITVISREEASRLEEESKKAESSRVAEESRLVEQSRKAEESKLAEESRKAEESRVAEEKKNTLYNAKDIKIVYKGMSENSYDKFINLYIENNSSKDITVQVRDFSINGYMIDPALSSNIAAGKKINDEIGIDKDDLDKNRIDEIKDVELKFFVLIGDDWSGNFETETIKFSV